MHKMSKYKLNFVTYFCQIELFAKSLILFRVTRVVSINLFFKYFFDNQWVGVMKKLFSESSLLIVNIVSLHSMTVNWISLGCWQNKISEDKVLCFSTTNQWI